MRLQNKRVCYKAFGFTVVSEFDLPELQTIILGNEQPDIAVIKTDLSELWEELATKDDRFVIKPDFVMFQIEDVAIYLVKNGNEIFVSPFADAEVDQIRLYILGTCMGAILFQRKILPLHGSAVAIDGKAYAVVGHSGAGKSTFASACLNQGYKLLSDDVIPVTLSIESIPIVTPSYPQQKLWQESLDQFGMTSDYLRPVIGRETKFAVPVVDQFIEEQLPLAGVFELIKTDNDDIDINSVQNLERLYVLLNHTYRNMFINELGLLQWHFNMTTKIASSINMFQLHRPTSRFTANELVEVMLTKIKEKETVL